MFELLWNAEKDHKVGAGWRTLVCIHAMHECVSPMRQHGDCLVVSKLQICDFCTVRHVYTALTSALHCAPHVYHSDVCSGRQGRHACGMCAPLTSRLCLKPSIMQPWTHCRCPTHMRAPFVRVIHEQPGSWNADHAQVSSLFEKAKKPSVCSQPFGDYQPGKSTCRTPN